MCCAGRKNYANWIIIVLLIILIGTDIFIHLPFISIESNYCAIVLGFVGILATFVVISNYAQVKDIERTFENKIDEINNKMGTIDQKLEEINNNQSLMDGSELVANALINACQTDEVIKAISHNGWVDGKTAEVEFRLKRLMLYKQQGIVNCEIRIVETNGIESGGNLENFTRITVGDKTTANIHGVVESLYKKIGPDN